VTTTPSSPAERTRIALDAVTGALPGAEQRPGQQQMAEAIATSIATKRHLIVAAGTGTGKTMAYLVPAALSGKRTVVATATKALQDQLATTDLPYLTEQLERAGGELSWAVLKGRSNYVCLQRLRELHNDNRLDLEDASRATVAEVRKLTDWSITTATGDPSELDWAPSDAAWRQVSVSGDECPGATRCPVGSACFAEMARQRAVEATIIVVNLHLYGTHIASGSVVLPEHDVLIIDEAHQTEDVISDTIGIQISPGRILTMNAALQRVLDDPAALARITDDSTALREVLGTQVGQRLSVPLPEAVLESLTTIREHVDTATAPLAKLTGDQRVTGNEDVRQRVLRAQRLSTRLLGDIDQALTCTERHVPFVSGRADQPRLEIAPLDVGPVMSSAVWQHHTAILTSATIPAGLDARLGFEAGTVEQIDVGSPFDYPAQGLLYCAMHLPDPRHPGFRSGVHDELVTLIRAAGGRTLSLFTSWKAMDEAAEAVRKRVDVPVLTQRDLPKPALIRKFRDDEATCLFATAGFFQGVDIPGQTLSLVTIDRLPFPRPDDPLLSARREKLGVEAFRRIDLPRAAMMLAQATGRLIRTASDRGVVAVFDRRLGAANYRWEIINALPPLRRTKERDEVIEFLRQLTSG